jgi:RNA polymerase sigma-70 factor (sigma-E family)
MAIPRAPINLAASRPTGNSDAGLNLARVPSRQGPRRSARRVEVPVRRDSKRDAEFSAYAAARMRLLRRSAYLLCGDWHRAEDLTQVALTKVYVAWPRVRRADNVDGYVRTVLVRAFLDEERRQWKRERPSDLLVERAGPDRHAEVDARVDLVRALATLPARQRAAVVLRCWHDLPVAEVARTLDCSEGTVKSQTSRGLAALRARLGGPAGSLLAEGLHQ